MNDKLKEILNIENRTKYFIHILTFFCICSIIIFALLAIGNNALNKKEGVARSKETPFDNIALVAKSAVVWDVVNQRELFSKNPDEPLPLASLTKVMTAITASQKLSNDSNIKIAPEYLLPEGDSNLVVGDTWRTKDLRDFTLVTSSNDGALALASMAERQPKNGNLASTGFIKEMNDEASTVGLLNSKFFNEHGLDQEIDKGGAYGSALDMALLFEYTLRNYPDILEATRYENVELRSAEKNYSAKNTNTAVNEIPNLIASKTGYTDLAGGNLVVAYDAGLNRPIIISILGSTEEGRFADTLSLVKASLKYIQQN